MSAIVLIAAVNTSPTHDLPPFNAETVDRLLQICVRLDSPARFIGKHGVHDYCLQTEFIVLFVILVLVQFTLFVHCLILFPLIVQRIWSRSFYIAFFVWAMTDCKQSYRQDSGRVKIAFV